MILSSSAFQNGKPIPAGFTCKGTNASPPLAWMGAPAGTRFFAFILDDPDAPGGTWTHWTFWNLAAQITELPAGADVGAMGATLGVTSARTDGYHGPCPPSGTHRYFFTLYALRGPLGLARGATVEQLRAAIKGEALGQCQLMGTFAK